MKPQGQTDGEAADWSEPGVSNIEITDPSIKEFEKIARKYGVDYAVKKDRSSSPPKYLIFFQGPGRGCPDRCFYRVHRKKGQKGGEIRAPVRAGKAEPVQRAGKNAVVDRNKRKELER